MRLLGREGLSVFNPFAPAPHVERLPDDEVRRIYPRLRWQILESTFIGYAVYYLVRNNVGVVAKDMKETLGYNDTDLGNILAATAISYGIGKFLMGALSDRSNPRVFMGVGLLLTAFCNFAFGASADYSTHFYLWILNGLFQGMGWSPCGRSMGHWFSEKERGVSFSIWNTSHNLGGGIAGVIAAESAIRLGGWQYAFYVPGMLAVIGAFYLFVRLRDTPQSVGLPPIEEYRDDYTDYEREHGVNERELSFRELLLNNVLFHKWIWLLAIANFFAYITRYAMIDWGPLYLHEVKGATVSKGGIAVLLLEWGGIPSTIFLGWVSDKLGGRRGMIAAICMIPIIAAYAMILIIPPGYLPLDMMMLIVIGFFIYPVINLITIIALDLTSKKAIGTAAGFIGLLGYLGRTTHAKGFGAMLTHYKEIYDVQTAWNYVIAATLASTIIAFVLLLFTWKVKPRA
ncbi:MAG TPA: MFS transporter [Candidatus Hydrogenedentes bacterium]|nr:MFS transporter [Candidatus Hydrogenedentota bacterium]